MSKQKIVVPEVFGEVMTCFIRTHPTQDDSFLITGDDQLALCRFDWEKDEATIFEQTSLPEPIGCISYNTDGSRISAGLRSGFYSMDSEVLTKGVDKRVFTDPIVAIAPFSLSNQSYNLVLGDEAGNLHLVDSRESTTVKDRLFKSRTEGVSITSMAVDDKIVYVTCENGIVEAFDLKKRGFIQDYEFSEKMLMHVFVDGRTPVVSTDEGEVLWLDIQNGRVKHKAKATGADLIIERVAPISDEYALVKSMGGENLMLLSLDDHKFIGAVSNEPAVDVDSTLDFEHVVVGVERNGHVNIEVWDTKMFLHEYNPSTPATNGDSNNAFFDGLKGDEN